MGALNSEGRYGWVTRTLHWLVALLVLGALGFGTWLANSPPSLSKIPYYATHKSVGILILSLVLLRILWHRMSPTPELVEHGWQSAVARWTHRLFYVLLLAMPLSGWIASSATGIDTVVFDLFTLPRIAPVSESWASTGFAVHGILGKLLALMILVHVAGAFVRRDGTVWRMVSGRPTREPGS